jgi:hypothetical protein
LDLAGLSWISFVGLSRIFQEYLGFCSIISISFAGFSQISFSGLLRICFAADFAG